MQKRDVFADVAAGSRTAVELAGMKKLFECAESGTSMSGWGWSRRIGRGAVQCGRLVRVVLDCKSVVHEHSNADRGTDHRRRTGTGMTDNNQPWQQPRGNVDETTILLGYLERQRAIFAWKTSELDAAGMRITVGASAITLGGLLKHLAHAEFHWFSTYLTGEEPPSPYDRPESWGEDWHPAANETPNQLRKLWGDTVVRSQFLIAQTVARGGLEEESRPPWDEGIGNPTLRWIICHMIEEYSRHIGHADLIRESVDGSVGEDPGSD